MIQDMNNLKDLFDYDKNESARALIAVVFTALFIAGPPIFALGLKNFVIGAGVGLLLLGAQLGLIYFFTKD